VSQQGGWRLEERAGTARELHEPWPPPELAGRRILCRCEVTGAPALVLGSGQRHDDVDPAAVARAGVDVVRRGSGGGAVLVAPGGQLWLDTWVPRRDQLWHEDVVRAAWWLGDVWAAALQRLGAPEPAVHRGRAVRSAWSERVCFAGVGPGEVSVEGRKVVGLSQRRTRAGVRTSSVVLGRWEPASLLSLFDLDDDERNRAGLELAAQAAGLDTVLTRTGEPPDLFAAVVSEVAAQLP
jgi:lipoate-protein ligase A